MTGSNQKIDKGPFFGMRHVIVIHLFFLIGIGVGMRGHLSVAIVAMTEATSANPDVPIYDWSNKSVILSSFFWGYIVLQIVAGEIGRKYGTKKILVGAMGVNSIACIVTPIIANISGASGVMACRVIQGLSQGFFFPSSFNLLGKWVPVEERSALGSLTLIGATFGPVVVMPIVGYVCSTWMGWPLSFYLHGGFGFLWVISWLFLAADSPAEHPYITSREKNYVESSLGVTSDTITQDKEVVPWKSIFTSLPFYAIVICHIGHNYGCVTLLTQIPLYMHKIIKFDIKSNGLLSAAPYLVCMFLGVLFGYLADFLINHKYASRQNTRKIFNTIAFGVPALAMLTLSFVPDDAKILSVMMLIVAVGLNAATSSGYNVNHIDLSPRFAGILMGIGNSTGNIFAIIAPLVVHLVVTDESDKSQWRIIFILSAVFYIGAAIFYIFFGSTKIQTWNSGAKVVEICQPSFKSMNEPEETEMKAAQKA